VISRAHRFSGHNSLNYTYRNGQVVRGESISLRYVRSRGEDYRAAVVVSKKVSKSAVLRNKIRRRVYEIIRTERKASNKPWPVDMIISVYDDRLAAMTSEDLRKAVISLLKKARII
jgi:ribonuclease P protein component